MVKFGSGSTPRTDGGDRSRDEDVVRRNSEEAVDVSKKVKIEGTAIGDEGGHLGVHQAWISSVLIRHWGPQWGSPQG